MITQETCELIWRAYREIEASEELLKKLKESQHFEADQGAATLKDAFGRTRHIQLGVPCGDNAHRIFDVRPQLAEAVITAHIAHQRAQLADMQARAAIEIQGGTAA